MVNVAGDGNELKTVAASRQDGAALPQPQDSR
jgi:hypothetical protein